MFAVCLCPGGFLASQSRAAYVAFVFACLLIYCRLRANVKLAIPLAAGIVLGVAAIISSPDTTPVPWLAAVVVITCGVSAITRLDVSSYRVPLSARVVLMVVVLALVVAAIVGLQHEIDLRALAPSDQDRASEWSAVWHQWRSALLLGVGPDRLLLFHVSDGSFAHFADNEYLQVAADSGIIGVALLAAMGIAITRTVSRTDSLASCAGAALICLAIGGAFDFDLASPPSSDWPVGGVRGSRPGEVE